MADESGGSGFIGRHLTDLLHTKGHKVTHWVSRYSRPDKVREKGFSQITWIELARHGIPANCDAVINLASETLTNPFKRWDEEFAASLEASRVDTTGQLVQAIHQAEKPPKVFIGCSDVSYYKADPEVRYTEESSGGDSDYFANLCQQWEDASQSLEGTGVRRVIVRSGSVLGRTGGLIHTLYLPYFFCLGGHLLSGQQWFPWIHVRDLTGIIVHAIENPQVTGVLNGVAPEQVTNAQFTKTFARTMNRPAPLRIPDFVVKKVFGEERAKVILEGQRVYPKRTQGYGYKFQYPDLLSACKEFSRIMKPGEFSMD